MIWPFTTIAGLREQLVEQRQFTREMRVELSALLSAVRKVSAANVVLRQERDAALAALKSTTAALESMRPELRGILADATESSRAIEMIRDDLARSI